MRSLLRTFDHIAFLYYIRYVFLHFPVCKYDRKCRQFFWARNRLMSFGLILTGEIYLVSGVIKFVLLVNPLGGHVTPRGTTALLHRTGVIDEPEAVCDNRMKSNVR